MIGRAYQSEELVKLTFGGAPVSDTDFRSLSISLAIAEWRILYEIY